MDSKKIIGVFCALSLLVVASSVLYNEYSIPQLISSDYNCEEHPSITTTSNHFYFESSQHYVNRYNDAVKKQIEEICN